MLTVIKKVYRFVVHVTKHDLIGRAAQTAFFMLLAFFPLALFAAMMLTQFEITTGLPADLLPPYLMVLLSEASVPERFSPWVFLISAWAASAAVWALMKAVYRAYTGKPLGSPLARLMAIGFTIGFVSVLALTLTFLVLGRWVGLFASAAGIFVLLFALYNFTPNTSARPSRAAWTAAVATAGWLLVTRAFEIYMQYFSKYTQLYGSIGAFLGLALWLFIISVVVILGAELGGYKGEYQRTDNG